MGLKEQRFVRTPFYLSKINDLAERTAVVLEPLEVRDPTV